MIRRDGGRGDGRVFAGGSALCDSSGVRKTLGGAIALVDSSAEPGDSADDEDGAAGVGAVEGIGRSIHGFSLGMSGVVYCESAATGNSQRLGAQMPTRTRHAAMIRLAL